MLADNGIQILKKRMLGIGMKNLTNPPPPYGLILNEWRWMILRTQPPGHVSKISSEHSERT